MKNIANNLKGMSVWVFICKWTNEYDSGVNTILYSSKKSAEQEMEKEINDEMTNWDIENDDIYFKRDGDFFEIYEDGYFARRHTQIYIEELKIN